MSAAGLLVIGAGPAAHSAAEAYRDAGGEGDVVMLAAEGRPPYRRPPLSKELLRGEAEPDGLPLAPPSFYAERRIDVRAGAITAIDADRGTATLAGAGEIAFERCVLATGAEPVRTQVPGAGLDGVHLLRTVADALALRERAVPGTRVVVVGSGFIGCEAAASLRARGCDVALLSVEPAPQAARLGDEVARRLAIWLVEAGVAARYGTTLESVAANGGGTTLRVATEDGEALDADLVLLAVGVRPRSSLASEAGLDLCEAGEVRADSAMRTSAPGVLACGDCARAEHAIAGRHLHVEHWGDALAQGRVAGTTAAGGDDAWTTVPGFWSTIGARTLKYAAWGDGYDDVRIVDHGGGAFTAWYGAEGRTVGVLTHERDDDYEAGRERVAAGAPPP
jgi:3-phenylpropionate/trans-cinnamate dioxygenase ferredoxin reductase subunit